MGEGGLGGRVGRGLGDRSRGAGAGGPRTSRSGVGGGDLVTRDWVTEGPGRECSGAGTYSGRGSGAPGGGAGVAPRGARPPRGSRRSPGPPSWGCPGKGVDARGRGLAQDGRPGVRRRKAAGAACSTGPEPSAWSGGGGRGALPGLGTLGDVDGCARR